MITDLFNSTKFQEAAARHALTEREREIMLQLSQGKRRKEVADALNVSLGTVKFHVEHIFKKVGATNLVEAMRRLF